MSTDGESSAGSGGGGGATSAGQHHDGGGGSAADGSAASSANNSNNDADKPALIARPPLDVYKKIAIIRKDNDEVVYQDTSGSLRKIADLAKASTSTAPALKKTKKSDIPTPNITLVPDYTRNVPPTYHVRTSFVRHVPRTVAEIEDTVEYNIDREDEDWWYDNGTFGPRAGWISKDEDDEDADADEEKKTGDGDSNDVDDDGDVEMEEEEDASAAAAASLTSKQLRKGFYTVPSQRSTKRKYPPPPGQPTLPTLPLQHFEQMIDILEKATGFETIITQSEAERLILGKIPTLRNIFAPTRRSPSPRAGGGGGRRTPPAAALPQKDTVTVRAVISEVYDYWVNKRSKLRKPLLRKYWPVTSANDTNPHLVFRPREKEKYKLRKKRMNDMEAYRKMRRLREDFHRLRTLMDLVVRRERLALTSVKLGCDLTDQRIYDVVDTSGLPRLCARIDADSVRSALDVPRRFDTSALDRTAAGAGSGRRGKKRKRGSAAASAAAALSSIDQVQDSQVGMMGDGGVMTAGPRGATGGGGAEVAPIVAAGETDGFAPLPNFLQPLPSRERNITSWDGSSSSRSSLLPTYVHSHPEAHRQQMVTMRYTRRPRVGRGGRIVYDRIPISATILGASHQQPPNVYFAGEALGGGNHNANATPLFRLLPKPIDHELVSRRIEHICAEAVSDDEQEDGKRAGGINAQPGLASAAALASIGGGNAAGLGGVAAAEGEENDGEATLVKVNDWIGTDDQLWGEERLNVGPI